MIVLTTLNSLNFYMNFRKFVNFCKVGSWNSDSDYVESVDQFEECCNLNNSIFQFMKMENLSIYFDLLKFLSKLFF